MTSLDYSHPPFRVISFGGVPVTALTDGARGEQCLPFSLRSCTTQTIESPEQAANVTLKERAWGICVRVTLSLDPACTQHWAVLTSPNAAAAPSFAVVFQGTAAGLAELEAKLSSSDLFPAATPEQPLRLYVVSHDTRARTGSFQTDADGPRGAAPGTSDRVVLGDSASDVAMSVGDVLRWVLVEKQDIRHATRVTWPECSCIPLCVHPEPDRLRREEHEALLLPFTGLLHDAQCIQSWGPSCLQRPTSSLSTARGTGVRRGETWEKELVRNPHEQMTKSPLPIDGAATQLVTGAYDYYHYRVDGFNDDGWGCAYRSLQTIVSWFQYEGFIQSPMPSLLQIQQILAAVDPDKAGKKQFVGSKEWIGSFEIMLVLQQMLPGLECTIRRLESGGELDTNPDVQALLLSHFSGPRAAPVMIGGSAYAHTILGVHMNQNTMEAQYLVLDPHYSSTTTNLKVVFSKHFLAWRRAIDLFAKDHWYNICVPRADAYDPR